MPRIKLQEQKSYPVSITLDVRVSDLNYGAHLGYDSLLALAHQARVEIFSKMGVTEIDLGDKKTGIVVSDVAVQYRGEAFVMDSLLFETAPIEIGLASFRMAHRVSNLTTKRPTALIEIGFAAFDYNTRRSGRLPEEFRSKLESV
jgi:acyl-CoA thioesterase FadM